MNAKIISEEKYYEAAAKGELDIIKESIGNVYEYIDYESDEEGQRTEVPVGGNQDEINSLALIFAFRNGHSDVVDFLMGETDKNQLLFDASEGNELEMVKEALAQGADIHAKNDYALRRAVYRGHALLRDYLLFEGADPQKVVDDILMTEGGVEWAKDFINARDLANKLTNDLAEKSSKADRLVASIDEDAEVPSRKAKATRQKI